MTIGYDSTLGDLAGFSLKKVGKTFKRTVKKVGNVGGAALRVVDTVNPMSKAVAFGKDVQRKGVVGALKAVPSRLVVSPARAVVGVGTSAARVFTSSDRTILSRVTSRADASTKQLQDWTQKRPIQTIAGAAAVVGAVYAAPAAYAYAAAHVGAAASAAGASAMTQAEKVAAQFTTEKAADFVVDKAEEVAEDKAKDVLDSITGGAPPSVTGSAPYDVPLPPKKSGAALPLAGAGAGFLAAGPIGAAVGGVVGYFLSKKA